MAESCRPAGRRCCWGYGAGPRYDEGGKAGFAKIWIRPVAFAAWCKERNVSPDQGARLTFLNEVTRITVMTFPNSR